MNADTVPNPRSQSASIGVYRRLVSEPGRTTDGVGADDPSEVDDLNSVIQGT